MRNSWPPRVLQQGMRSLPHRHTHPARALTRLTLLLCAVCAAVAPTARAAPSLSWSAPADVDGARALSGISCPSSALCVAIDKAGGALVSVDPTFGASATWRRVEIDEGHALNAVSCPSSALCVAVDATGRALSSTDPAAGSGASWRAVEIDEGQELGSVSCASASLCVATDQAGHGLLSTDPGAGVWSAPASSDIDGAAQLTGVSCVSTALCVATDEEGHALLSTEPAAGASTWHSRLIDSALKLTGISCFLPDSCVAVDALGNELASANTAATIGTGPGSGATWSSTAFDALGGAPVDVSCAATSLCVAVDDTGYAFASDNPLAAPPFWPASSVEPPRPLTGVACVSEGLCVLVDAAGRVSAAEVPAPSATTGPAAEVSHTTAVLTGAVAANDAALTACRFEYGTSTEYGSSVSCANAPSGGASQPVGATLAGLATNTTYHYRLVASSAIGTSTGADQSFQTLAAALVEPHPSIGGTPAPGQRLTCKSGVTSSAATLAYAWFSDTRAIAGATGSTYVVATADVSHHLQCRVTASTAEGSKSATSAFVTVPAGGLGTISETTVGAPRAGRGAVSLPLRCSAQAAGSCTIKLRLTVLETLRGSRIVAVAARGGTRRLTATVGSSTVRMRPGQQLTATVALNATGRRLLARMRHLAVKLSVSGTVVGAISASLKSATVTLSATAKVSSHRASSRRGP
jgi:hypothetical protein